jgi:hypothetical protein
MSNRDEVGKARMWLSPEFLTWRAFIEERVYSDDRNLERAYEIWAHSEQILGQYNDDLHLVDAVTTLKRAMSHRLQLLKNTYRFDAIPVKGNSKRTIEQLAFWGMVRPTMLGRLIEIRNAVEHDDASPPSHERCTELLDFVWYFLRSTDRLVIRHPAEIMFESEVYTRGVDNTYVLVFKMAPRNNWKLDFGAWINASMLLEHDQGGWLEVQIDQRATRDEVRSRLQYGSSAHENRKEDDLSIEGNIVGPESQLQRIFDLYFKLELTGD